MNTTEKNIDYPIYILAGIITVGIIILAAALFKFNLPESNKEIAYILFGGFITNFGAVVNYFFGSSKGSSDKNKIISTIKNNVNGQ